MSILSLLELSPEQEKVVLSASPALVVTAGAGSGKTRTLAGRYLWHVEQGHSVRSLIAVTFTEKAAREMRNRIRDFIRRWREAVIGDDERVRWDRAFVELDAARIGTIHSLCAAILRAHPAEAAIDPLFEVLEENTALLMRAQAVEITLAWAIDDPESARLFGPLKENRLRETLAQMLAFRLDAAQAFTALADAPLALWAEELAAWLTARLSDPDWQLALADLGRVRAVQPDDRMETARQEVLAIWQMVEEGRAIGDWAQVVAGLFALRKASTHLGAKANWQGDDLAVAKSAMKTLRDFYDENLKPLLGDTPPSWELDMLAAGLQTGLHRLFEKCLAIYTGMKDERHALDFDDLENLTVLLLTNHPEVRARWQSETAAVLVDEFQDTNARQREIIYAVSGFPRGNQILAVGYSNSSPNIHSSIPNLFIVGDGKQSIYRFRGAQVEVFLQTHADIVTASGQAFGLNTTYRAHQPLVQTLNQLLAPIMGSETDPARPYLTPFSPLTADRAEPTPAIQSPFLEFHLGLGNAAEGRASAAAGLAARLQRLHDQGCEWGDMALLFRASTAFGVYEDALEAAGIPFVTVAGRGFYDRPEVRDLLNALAAIADPSDDLAMAGLLRSPLFGLTDAALFLLRWGEGVGRDKIGFWDALWDEPRLAGLDEADRLQAIWARGIVSALHALAGRQPVAFVLKQLLDRTYYRAALQQADIGERAWRNVEKLLADAHRSRLVGISSFLTYVQSVRDVDAREGEAVSEAADSVQLMTIHKAKGLEFPITVLADASYSGGYRQPAMLLDDRLGPLLRISDDEESGAKPVAFQLGILRQKDMEEAESQRLLYVAATRAAEKLLISGYASIGKSGNLQMRGWLKTLGEVVGLSEIQLDEAPSSPVHLSLPWQDTASSLTIYPIQDEQEPAVRSLSPPARVSPSADLIAPLLGEARQEQTDDEISEQESDPPPRVWRVVAQRRQVPNWVVGALVHKALQHWRFPNEPDFEKFLKPFALEKGLVGDDAVREATVEAAKILQRFKTHPLFNELTQAERMHELVYALETADGLDAGVIDLAARSTPGDPWHIYDFKTDILKRDDDLVSHVTDKHYDKQMRRYISAVEQLIGVKPLATFVFLNAGGLLRLLPWPSTDD
ncbi:MAG: UvrD-helicase domain-containing protein [Caldilineales bacterium]|nr:UvrD-helicase domain-containing protein [Caldilineales bacterium]